MRTPAAFAVLWLVAACQAPPPEMTEAEKAQYEAEVGQAINERWSGYRDALMGGDVAEIMSFFTADIHLYQPGMDFTGADFSDFLHTALATTRITGLEVRRKDLFVHGDIAYEILDLDETLQVEGQEPLVRELYAFFRWKKEEGVWLMDRMVGGPREAPPEG